ncbi:MAG TPA: hypothetical protein P5096_00085 [Patescibacteria group bacterium]|nr:hypothetical protein [Patescibacteria group bacterium]
MEQSEIEKIDGIKKEMVRKIVSDERPVSLSYENRIILHLIPLGTLDYEYSLDLSTLFDRTVSISPIHGGPDISRINVDGVLACGGNDINKTASYVQLYRNGIVEAVDCLSLASCREGKTIKGLALENVLIDSLTEYLKILKDLGVNMPMMIFLTLIGVGGCGMATGPAYSSYDGAPIDRDNLDLPGIIINSYDEKPETILRPLFDLIWNACGLAESLNYDNGGNHIKARI